MENLAMSDSQPDKIELDIWHCAGCDVVHLAAGRLRLSFDRGEFASFTEKIVDLYCRGWLWPDASASTKNLGKIDGELRSLLTETAD